MQYCNTNMPTLNNSILHFFNVTAKTIQAYYVMEVKNMSRPNCCLRNDCLVVAIISSIFIGIIAGVLRATAIITITPAFLWVLLGIAVVYLAIAFVASTLRRFDTPYSARSTVGAFIAGVLGTILFSIILLGIPFAVTSVVGAVLTALLLASFSLIITSVACLVLSAYTDN